MNEQSPQFPAGPGRIVPIGDRRVWVIRDRAAIATSLLFSESDHHYLAGDHPANGRGVAALHAQGRA
jgi:hypothetical protein